MTDGDDSEQKFILDIQTFLLPRANDSRNYTVVQVGLLFPYVDMKPLGFHMRNFITSKTIQKLQAA